MKIEFKTPKIKIDYDGKIRSYINNDNTDEPGFIDINLDWLYTPYKLFPWNTKSITNYYNDIYKALEKYLSRANLPQNQTHDNIEDKPDVIRATGHDIYNYVARYGMANYQNQTVMKLNGRLNPNKLIKAVRLSVDAQPIFGSRLIENDPPYWKRLDDIDNTVFCLIEETNNLDESIKRFLESPLDMDHDPMVKLKLIRSDSYDTLCVKLNHSCCDGTGTKEYLQLLSDIYSAIDGEDGDFTPQPAIRSRKEQDILFKTLGIDNPETAWDPLLEVPKTMWPFPWKNGGRDIARISVCSLPYGHIDKMHEYGKSKGATINDLIVAAYYRALFKMSQPLYGIPMDISMTADLRRYLPNKKAEAIRNFSGGFDTRLARVAGESFAGTLSRVIPMMNKVKSHRPGLQSAVGLERVEKSNFYQTLAFYQNTSKCSGYVDKCAPVLSNLGFINKSLFKFGEVDVTDAYIVPPAVSAPGIFLCTGTYNGVLTMAASYYEGQLSHSVMNKLLNLIKKELMEGCKL